MKHFSLSVLIVFSSFLPAIAEDGKRYLIIHADDAGMSHSVNQGTIQGLESGIVSSASIMVPCPWFKEFAQYAAKHPEFDYGIHLTLNSEWDVYRWGPVASKDKVPSLVDPEGYLWDNVEQIASHAKASEVAIELRAQIQKAKQFGVPLTHLDTHMGAVMSRPDLIEVYIKLGEEYNLPVLFIRTLAPELRSSYPALVDRHATAIQKLDKQKLPILDNLLQFYGGDNFAEREKVYTDAIDQIPEGVTELIIHCGIDNEELRHITNSSSRRDHDRRLFCSDAIRQRLKEQKIELLTWKQFHEMVKK